MYSKVFVSHNKDDPNLDFFHRIFSGINTKAIWMEFENIIPPPYESIRKEVNQSNAIFVLLSEPLLNKPHTSNWVSFEIGLAANYRSPAVPYRPQLFKQIGLDVYVFEPFQTHVNFAVPYCTYYMLYEGNIEELKLLKEMIQNAPSHNKGLPVKCQYKDCQVEFKLLSNIEEFYCPTCRRGIELKNH